MPDHVRASDLWTASQADRYDNADDPMFAPALLERTSAFLAGLAGSGRALEFAIGMPPATWLPAAVSSSRSVCPCCDASRPVTNGYHRGDTS